MRAATLLLVLTSFLHSKEELPSRLEGIQFADEAGIIDQVVDIAIPEVPYPYNSSIIRKDGKIFLFYRHDKFDVETNGINSFIGVSELSPDFSKASSPIALSLTNFLHAEDPRVVNYNNSFYLSFVNLIKNEPEYRSIHLGKITDLATKVPDYENLDQHISPIEKNWTPFITTENGEQQLFFEYSINPHKILKYTPSQENPLTHLTFPSSPPALFLSWEKKWGKLRGGTPAICINDEEFLSFFHSSFFDYTTEKRWYVMGAYIFNSSAPYNITKISPYPILFDNIYATPHEHTSPASAKVIFPAGIIKGAQDNQIHVSCGENDCATKIISFNIHRLIKSLQPVEFLGGSKSTVKSLLQAQQQNSFLKEGLSGAEAAGYEIKKVKGLGKFLIDSVEDNIKSHLNKGIYWEEGIANILASYAKPGDNVIDIGAHIGVHTIMLANKVGDIGHVFAFEPQIKMFKENQWNQLLNHTNTNTTLLRYALGDTHKEIEMDVRDQSNEGGTSVGSGGDKAFMIPLDSIELPTISLMKIDVENSEELVIDGAINIIKRDMPVILFELLGATPADYEEYSSEEKATHNRVIKKLTDIGYKVELIYGKDYLATPPDSHIDNVYHADH